MPAHGEKGVVIGHDGLHLLIALLAFDGGDRKDWQDKATRQPPGRGYAPAALLGPPNGHDITSAAHRNACHCLVGRMDPSIRAWLRLGLLSCFRRPVEARQRATKQH
jgi:hypothetical protein